jgi:restriction endonuclease Mrr
MAIPDYETLMLPILHFLSEGGVKKTREIINKIIREFEYNGPQNLNQLLRDIETAKAKFRFIPKKEVHEKKLQWEV